VAATTEHEGVTFPRDYATVLDVGANRGQFALFALHRFPRARLVCFEPLIDARRTLTKVVGGNPRVRIEACAVGAAEASLPMNVARSDDSSSLLSPTPLQLSSFPGTASVGSVEVSVRRLDDVVGRALLDTPILLKIDVQGFELEVLKGAENLLADGCDVLVECSFSELYAGQPLADEVICELFSRGLRLRGIFSITKDADGVPLQGDLLFAR
jgi:FkbM family methyltransferase